MLAALLTLACAPGWAGDGAGPLVSGASSIQPLVGEVRPLEPRLGRPATLNGEAQSAAGGGYLVTLSGGSLKAERRDGDGPVRSFSTAQLAGGTPSLRFSRVSWDGATERWCFAALGGRAVWLALSESSDPTGRWTSYRLADENEARKPVWLAVSFEGGTVHLMQRWLDARTGQETSGVTTVAESDLRNGWSEGRRQAMATAAGLPRPTSISPASGAGAAQQFLAYYDAPGGASTIQQAHVLVNSTLSGQNACWIWYDGVSNQLGLVDDSGTDVNLAYSGVSSNSQCSLDRQGSSVSVNGTTLTLTLSLTFKPAFGGAKALYLRAADGAGSSEWEVKGSWLAPDGNVPPGPASIHPASGSGLQQKFSASFNHVYGASLITHTNLLFNYSLTGLHGCWVTYSSATPDVLYLVNDAGTGITGSVGLGTSQTIANSQCTLHGSGSSIFANGSTLTVSASLSFDPVFFGGAKVSYAEAGAGSQTSGWQVVGDWIVPNNNPPPRADWISPSSGGGTSMGFQTSFSNAGGGAALSQVQVLINSSLSPGGACWIFFEPGAGRIGLVNDQGSTVEFVATGSAAVLQNSQCVLDVGTASWSVSGSSLLLSLPLAFKSSFGGTKAIYMQALAGGLTSGWDVMGSWTVPLNQVAPGPLSLSPGSGAGSAAVVTETIWSASGAAAITSAQLLINSSLAASQGCWIWYDGATRRLGLVNDAGTAVMAFVQPGTGASVENSQCRLNGSGSSVSVSGTVLTLQVSVTFQSGFAGGKQIYGGAAVGSLDSAWQWLGSWLVQ